jgi:hypothetical protein
VGRDVGGHSRSPTSQLPGRAVVPGSSLRATSGRGDWALGGACIKWTDQPSSLWKLKYPRDIWCWLGW